MQVGPMEIVVIHGALGPLDELVPLPLVLAGAGSVIRPFVVHAWARINGTGDGPSEPTRRRRRSRG